MPTGQGVTFYVDNVALIGKARAWITKVIKFKYILVGFGVGWLMYSILTILKAPTLLFYGFVNGLIVWPHHAIPLFVGGMLGRYYFRKKFGERKWRAYAPILLAGYGCGVSLVGMVCVSIVLISKSISQVVF